MTFTATTRAKEIERDLAHAPAAIIAAELEAVRSQVRLLFATYGPCPHRIRAVLKLEARHRYLRELLRASMAEAEATETRTRSAAAFGLERGPRASWPGSR